MHIQVPSRIMYINGFKGARHLIDNNIDLDEFQGNSQLAGMGLVRIAIVFMPDSAAKGVNTERLYI